MNFQLLEIITSNILRSRIRSNLKITPTCFLYDSLHVSPAPRNTYSRQDHLYINHLSTKLNPFYLKTQSASDSKHLSPKL